MNSPSDDGNMGDMMKVGSKLLWVGAARIYFNRHADAPQVWSVDNGIQETEVTCARVRLCAAATTVYSGEAVNNTRPVAWLACHNVVVSQIGDLVIIR